MQHPMPMRGGDRPADGNQQRGRFAWRQRSVDKLSRQRRPRDVLHTEIRMPVVFAHFVNRDDVRMIQLSRRFGFRPETFGVDDRRH
jgi:hypothetical protein